MRTANQTTQSGDFIVFDGIEKAFGRMPVLRGIDLRVRAGEIFTLLGGSGTGKSVMLKHIIGLLHPDPSLNRSLEGHSVDLSSFRISVGLKLRY